MTDKDDLFARRILDLAGTAYHRGIVTYSDFLDLNQQNIVNRCRNRMPGTELRFSGGYEHAERQMVAFHPDAPAYFGEAETEDTFPIRCIRIEPRAVKFSEELTHRDYLGAILNLGIDRAVTGDILVQDHCAWVFCHSKITDFLLENITRIRHTEVKTALVDDPSDLPAPHLVEIKGTCASVRLDALISIAFQTSRSSMVAYIEGGKVFSNGKLITSNGYEPKEGDIISVRGKGRFRFDGVSGQTRKGRTGVRLSLFQ